VHFPLGRTRALHVGEVTSSLRREEAGWTLTLAADRFQQSVHIAVPGYRPADDWFHLLPGEEKTLPLLARPGTNTDALPEGEIVSLSGSILRF